MLLYSSYIKSSVSCWAFDIARHHLLLIWRNSKFTYYDHSFIQHCIQIYPICTNAKTIKRDSKISPSMQIKEVTAANVRRQWFSCIWLYIGFILYPPLIEQLPFGQLFPNVTCLHELLLFCVQNMENPPMWYPSGNQATHQTQSHLHVPHVLFTLLTFITKDIFMDRIFNEWVILIKHRSSKERAESEARGLLLVCVVEPCRGYNIACR